MSEGFVEDREGVPCCYTPEHLPWVVQNARLWHRWTMRLVHEHEDDGSGGLMLWITSVTPNSYAEDQEIRVLHAFLVPGASYNRRTWTRWVFDRFRQVLDHEAGEFFVVDGERPFGPHHGNGEDPYAIWQVGGTVADVRKKAGQD